MKIKQLGPLLYNVEHLIEAPLEKVLFGKTRYSGDNWFFKCMCSRILWIYDLLAYFRFSLYKKFGMWDNSEWNEYVKFHNNQLYNIGHCGVYEDMIKLNPPEFGKSYYRAEKFRSYMIPCSSDPTSERLKMWLFHYPDAGELII